MPPMAMLPVAALLVLIATAAAQPAAHTRRWNQLPSDPTQGRMPDGPMLGNGDLGVSVFADLVQGAVVLYLGLNQMWGTSKNCSCPEHQPSCCTQTHTDFYDVVFPRRLAVGSVTVQADALRHSNFSAQLNIATAHVTVNLTSPTAALGLALFLTEDENALVIELAPSGALGSLNISTAVQDGKQVCQHDFHKGILLCEPLDGEVRSAAAGSPRCDSVYASRQPLSAAHSPKPITAAIATSVPPVSAASCGTTAPFASSWVGAAPQAPWSLLTRVVTNLDLCPTAIQPAAAGGTGSGGPCDPLPVALAAAAKHSAATPAGREAAVAALRAAHDTFWVAFWSNSSISLPTERATEALWYSAQWLIGSASRPGKVAPGLWGPWVHTDQPGWEGDFTLDYNFGASYWGSDASNRLALAESQFPPLLAYMPKARQNALAYGVTEGGALHYTPHLAPWGYESTLGRSPGGDMSLHWAGVLSALNLVSHWEYSQDVHFLREISFPFARDTLRFYQGWMTHRGGVWRNDKDSDECDQTNQSACYALSPNLICPNAFIRRLASALPSMAAALGPGTAIDPQWDDIADNLVPMPSGPCAAGAPGKPNHQVWLAADGAKPTEGFSAPLGGGDMAATLWPVFPAEVVGRNSSADAIAVGRSTLLDTNGWCQGNSFCMVFTAATRLRVPLDQWWPAWTLVLNKSVQANGLVRQSGGGLEVAGASQSVADMLMQSSEGYIELFPAWNHSSPAAFSTLRAKGAFLVSASLSATGVVSSPVTILSEAGIRCVVETPWPNSTEAAVSVHDVETGSAVPLDWESGRWLSFNTSAGASYHLGKGGSHKTLKTDDQWCPAFHTIKNHYDPSGPIYDDESRLWHIFPDGCAPDGNSNANGNWCHYTSPDLISWSIQDPLGPHWVGNGATGSISVTEQNGAAIAIFPALVVGQHQKFQNGLLRQVAAGGLGPNMSWGKPVQVASRPKALGLGLRDPTRAIELNGRFYVGVGSGFGGDNPTKFKFKTSPSHGTGCLAWMQASNSSLLAFQYAGCLLTRITTLGSIGGSGVAWSPRASGSPFECPNIFPIGTTGNRFMAIANLNAAQNEFWIGTIEDNRFDVESAGLLDFGQYYAARSGSGVGAQSRSERRVLFGDTSWKLPKGFDRKCSQNNSSLWYQGVELLPRDLGLDSAGKLTIRPTRRSKTTASRARRRF